MYECCPLHLSPGGFPLVLFQNSPQDTECLSLFQFLFTLPPWNALDAIRLPPTPPSVPLQRPRTRCDTTFPLFLQRWKSFPSFSTISHFMFLHLLVSYAQTCIIPKIMASKIFVRILVIIFLFRKKSREIA